MQELDGHIPTHPKVRPLDIKWVSYQGSPYAYVRDPLNLSQRVLLVPQALAPILALCDGTRDVPTLQAALALHGGLTLPMSQVEDVLRQFEATLLFENGRFQEVAAKALQEYRDALHRKPSHAGAAYPADPGQLSATLRDFCDGAIAQGQPADPPSGGLAGILSPHIDFWRGGAIYASVWKQAAPVLQDVELAIVLGTDHCGSPGKITLTRQSYATPWGVLPTDVEVVDALAQSMGHEAAFAEELHHINEHSIELAAVWLHHFLGTKSSCKLVPILCGSFHHPDVIGVDGENISPDDGSLNQALSALREAARGRRTLVIAAGDLAHVGPSFGDDAPIDAIGRATLAAEDTRSLEAVCAGDAEGFLKLSKDEMDRRKICGLPPIYLMLRLLGGAKGHLLGYSQCPADATNTSFVSIAGVLLYKAS